MTYKEYGEEAEIVITVTIEVNDEVAYNATTYDIDNAIAGLGSAERHNVIADKLNEQYQDMPEAFGSEEMQERADEARQSMREDGIAI